MSEFGENLKNMVKKGIETIGIKAGDLAAGAKQKVNAFNLAGEKNDLLSSIGKKVYEQFLESGNVPEGLEEELKKIAEIDKELEEIRAAKNEENEEAEDGKAGEAGKREETEEPSLDMPSAVEFVAKDDRDVPVIEIGEEEKEVEDCPLSSAINDLFEKMPPVDKMMDKVNNSLDDLGENLRRFSSDFDRQLNEFSDQMMGKDDSGKEE